MLKFITIAASVALLGFVSLETEASPSPQDLLPANYYDQQQQQQAQLQAYATSNPMAKSNSDSDQDSDDEDEDDDIANAQAQLSAMTTQNGAHPASEAAMNRYVEQEATGNYQQVAARPSASDLKTAASHHKHHGHGAKGWLDMGAWTGKKGAFGWHDKHPVGKKGRK